MRLVFKAKDNLGRVVNGELEAEDPQQALEQLTAQGFVVEAVRARVSPVWVVLRGILMLLLTVSLILTGVTALQAVSRFPHTQWSPAWGEANQTAEGHLERVERTPWSYRNVTPSMSNPPFGHDVYQHFFSFMWKGRGYRGASYSGVGTLRPGPAGVSFPIDDPEAAVLEGDQPQPYGPVDVVALPGIGLMLSGVLLWLLRALEGRI